MGRLYRPSDGFTTILGAFAVAGGVADLAEVDLPIGPAVLIVIGLSIVFSVWRRAEHPTGPSG